MLCIRNVRPRTQNCQQRVLPSGSPGPCHADQCKKPELWEAGNLQLYQGNTPPCPFFDADPILFVQVQNISGLPAIQPSRHGFLITLIHRTSLTFRLPRLAFPRFSQAPLHWSRSVIVFQKITNFFTSEIEFTFKREPLINKFSLIINLYAFLSTLNNLKLWWAK